MRKRDLDKFKKILTDQRELLLGSAKKAVSGDIHLDPDDFPDEIDSASRGPLGYPPARHAPRARRR